MWRETNLFGVYMSPLLMYALVALLIWLPIRFVLLRLRLLRRFDNPAVAQLSIYLGLLAALVTWL